MLSRREWIGRLLTLGSVTGVIGRGRAAEPPAEKAVKASKETVKYQDQPNNMQMCGMCKFYTPPGGKAGAGMMGGQMMGRDHQGGMMGGQMGGMMAAGTCQVVAGSINPMGWCILYQPISR